MGAFESKGCDRDSRGINPILTQDISGENRNDIGLIIDSSNILGVENGKNFNQSNKQSQDLKVLEALQS